MFAVKIVPQADGAFVLQHQDRIGELDSMLANIRRSLPRIPFKRYHCVRLYTGVIRSPKLEAHRTVALSNHPHDLKDGFKWTVRKDGVNPGYGQ